MRVLFRKRLLTRLLVVFGALALVQLAFAGNGAGIDPGSGGASVSVYPVLMALLAALGVAIP